MPIRRSGVPPPGSSPRSVIVLTVTGSAIDWFSAALAFLTISGDRPGGPYRPMNEVMRKSFRPSSSAVGTCASAGTRLSLVTISARKCPDRTQGAMTNTPSNIPLTRPYNKSSHTRGSALVGVWGHRRPAHALAQQFHRRLRENARPGGGVVDAVLRLDPGEQLAEVLPTHVRMHREHQRRLKQQADRLQPARVDHRCVAVGVGGHGHVAAVAHQHAGGAV